VTLGLILNLISILKFNFYPLIFTVYLSISIVRSLNPAHIIQSLILTIIGCLAFFKLFNNKKIQVETIVFLSLIATYLISCFVLKRYDRIIQHLAFITINPGVAYLMRMKKISSSQINIIFSCVATLFFLKIINHENPVTALKVMSGNGISLILSVVVIPYYIARHFEGKRLIITPALINFIICIWAGGRAGIIGSFISLLGILWIKYKHLRSHFFLGLFFIFIFEFIFHYLFGSIFRNLYFFKFAFERFSAHSFFNDPRISMALDYFQSVDTFSFIFGSDLKQAWPAGARWNYDPHNSFINLICKNGILGYLNIILTLTTLKFLFKMNILFFVLFLNYIILALTDSFLFYESWDFLFIFFLAYSFSAVSFSNIKFPPLRLIR